MTRQQMTIEFLTRRLGPGALDNGQRGRYRPQESPPHRTPTQSFDITTRRLIISVVIIGVSGDIDMLTASRLQAEIARQLRSAPRILVLDLREVSFLSASGVRTLLVGREAAQQSNTTLSLVYEAAAVGRPLSVLGLTDFFPTSTDLFNIPLPDELVLSEPDLWQG